MAIDTSIYGRIRPFEMEDPFDSATKAYQAKGMQKQFRLDKDLEEAGKASGGDPFKMADALQAKGHWEPALKLRAQGQAQRKAKVTEDLQIAEAAGSDAISLDTLWRQSLQQSGGDRAAALARVQPAYMQIANKWRQLGKDMNPDFDPDENFAAIGAAKEAVQHFKSLAPDVRMTDTGGQITPTNVNPNAGPVGPLAGAQPIPKTAAPAGPTELARYQAERAAMQPGDPRIPDHDRVIASFKGGRGTDITIQQPGPMAPGKAGANKVDEDMLGVTRGLMQLDAIQAQFKPEFQQYMDKASYAALAVKEKAGFKLTNKQQKDLTEFAAYRRNAVNSLNEYIKSITGAAMSEPEAKRILSGMPKPGDGIFDGDSPTEFRAKLDDAVQKTKMAVARLAYIKRNGMSLEDGAGNATIPLERMPQTINARGQEIEAELKRSQPKIDARALKRAVRRQLGVEFGLASD